MNHACELLFTSVEGNLLQTVRNYHNIDNFRIFLLIKCCFELYGK